eukprot:7602915-Lingulodinium_polyedra.AAC.1
MVYEDTLRMAVDVLAKAFTDSRRRGHALSLINLSAARLSDRFPSVRLGLPLLAMSAPSHSGGVGTGAAG